MGFLKVFEIFRTGIVMFRLDVFALDEQKAFHVCHIVGKERRRGFDHRDHHRQDPQADQKCQMEFTHIIDVLVFPDRPAGNDENRGAFHRSNIWSASTNLASFSRPCEATRMWKLSMPILFAQSRTYMRCSFNRSPWSSAEVMPPLILNSTKLAPVGYTSIPDIVRKAL